MHRVLAFSLLSLAAAAYAQSQSATKATHSTGTAASSTSVKKNSTHTHATAVGAKSRTRARSTPTKGRKVRAKAAPSYQLHPDPERYQQIQQALADRGYFKGQVNGEWGDDSVDALKKFQADQKLDTDGKINAPSLIGLGLGPKHDGTTGRTAPVPPPPPSPAVIPPATSAPSANPEPPATPEVKDREQR